MGLHLIVANKTYSSWSFRPWFAMRVAGIPFEETVVSLDATDFKDQIRRWSGAGKVPVLIDGSVVVWESLAILEYVAELFPEKRLWPQDRAIRAQARAVAAEMHAGFVPLRQHLTMNMRRPVAPRELTAEVQADVVRVDAIWRQCRERYGGGGDFLFGTFTAVDAMFAPVVSRFHTYAVAVSDPSQAYMAAVQSLPAWAEWREAALREPWVLPQYEVDCPAV